MNTTSKVSIFDVTEKAGRTKPWLVRRRVGTKEKSKSFPTKKAAQAYRSRLQAAALAGELFDVETGEPASWHSAAATPTVLAAAKDRVTRKWGRVAATTRKSMVEGLATALPALVSLGKAPQSRAVMYSALMQHLDPAWRRARRRWAVTRPHRTRTGASGPF